MSTGNSGKNSRCGRPENLKPSSKGRSGNPGGRPKSGMVTKIFQELYEEHPAIREATKKSSEELE